MRPASGSNPITACEPPGRTTGPEEPAASPADGTGWPEWWGGGGPLLLCRRLRGSPAARGRPGRSPAWCAV